MDSRKRPAPPELHNFDDVSQPYPNANLHAVVKSLSPVKKGRHSIYFDGVLTDGSSTLRMVGFRSEQQKRLSAFSRDKTPISLQNCEIKQSRQGHQMEVMLKNSTQIVKSPKVIEVPDEEDIPEIPAVITLSQIRHIQQFQKVSTEVKVLVKREPIYVSTGKMKQDVIVADHTSTMKVTLWEDYVDFMEEDKSYSLTDFVVREYNCHQYLSMPKEGATIAPIEDIGEVEQPDDDSDLELVGSQVSNAQIIGVPQLESYKSCLKCKARVEPLTAPLGRCSKGDCAMMQRYDLCTEQLSARLLVLHCTSASDNRFYKTLHAFGSVVQRLAGVGDGEVTVDDLLNASPFKTISYNDKNVVTGFTKE